MVGTVLDKLEVTYEQACISTSKEKYYTTLLETLVNDNNRNGALLSNEKLQQVVGKSMEEMEAEFKCRNKITMDTSYQSPIQNKGISTINDSTYYESDDQADTISDSKEQVDPSSDPRVKTHITDGIKKLSIRLITIEPVVIGQDLVTSVREILRDDISLKSLNVKETVTEVTCNIDQVDRIYIRNPSRDVHNQPGVNIFFQYKPR